MFAHNPLNPHLQPAFWRQALKRGLADNRGQSMVEFAIVLPILLLLTLGTIMLTVSYLQKSQLNGLTFMASRAAAVRRSETEATRFTLDKYREQSGQTWVQNVTPSYPNADPQQVAVRLSKPAQRLDILANLLSGQPGTQPGQLSTQIQLPREYPESGSTRPQTYNQVDYQYHNQFKPPWLELPAPLDKLVFDSTQMADKMTGGPDKQDDILSLTPPNENLLKFYEARGWSESDFRAHDEEEKGAGFDDFKNMRIIGEQFKLLQNGTLLLDQLLKLFLGPFAGPIKEVLGAIGAEAAAGVERGMSGLATTTDVQVRQAFGGGL